MCCVVEKMEDRINTANHMVAINRTRCILMEIEVTVVFFGLYSDSMARLGVREKDLVMICCPTVVRIKLKPKQFLPPNLSTWTVLRDSHSQESLSSNWRIKSSARRWRFR